ncbi:winged helix-turn-helix domain-containing protein [Halobacterium salinarum]|uniref:winged helix-turn-helix domain-containing protein n=1 Tax=Halobacterium salinarum TaxID=2242 RepID=UPI0025574DF1|nr:winged helix-turn-helix domain-containing protein [Halobacterium salinarum]MDL0124186.1 winged helix-turn-helix domain-containing protein [Halobacterium salinarum]
MADSHDGDDQPAYVSRWKEATTGFDRVRSVASSLENPRTAGWIADEAHVSEPTARNHLDRLVDLGVLVTDESPQGKTYYPDPVYTRLTAIQELVAKNSEPTLSQQATAIHSDIATWKAEYDVESPRSLRASVTNEISVAEAQKRLRIAADWESAQYQLSLLRDAIDHYETYTARPPTSA